MCLHTQDKVFFHLPELNNVNIGLFTPGTPPKSNRPQNEGTLDLKAKIVDL